MICIIITHFLLRGAEVWLEKLCNVSMRTSCRGVRGSSPGKNLKTKNAEEAITDHFAKRFKVSNLPEFCLFAAVSEEKVPIYISLKCLWTYKIEVIVSMQICRKVLNAYVDPAYQIATAFWNLKTGSLQEGISNAKLEKVICSRDVEAVLIKWFYEQTMLSLHKTIQSNWKGYANMRVPVKGLRLLPWNKPIYYQFTNTERVKRAKRAREKKQNKTNNNNILYLFIQKVGLIVKFYKFLSQ